MFECIHVVVNMPTNTASSQQYPKVGSSSVRHSTHGHLTHVYLSM